MKYLGIKKGRAYFVDAQGKEIDIEQIAKDDILYLLDLATNINVEFEMDDYQENILDNQAHKIIYESLYDKFKELLENRTRFYDESTMLYAEAKKKYNLEE